MVGVVEQIFLHNVAEDLLHVERLGQQLVEGGLGLAVEEQAVLLYDVGQLLAQLVGVHGLQLLQVFYVAEV